MTTTRKPQRPPETNLRALIYCRVSNDAGGRGRSVHEQRADCERECQRNGWNVVEVLTDNDVGASKHSAGQRVEWARAKALLANAEADVLETWESSRAQRDLAAYIELRELCTGADVLWSYSGDVYDMTNPDDAYRTGADALDAEREAGRTSKRVKRAIAANARAGMPSGGSVPFGYRRVHDPETFEMIRTDIDPVTGPLVAELVRRVIAGASLGTLTRELNTSGVTTTRGNLWTTTTLRQMLISPTYAGWRVHQGEVLRDVVAKWEPIISDDEHRAVVAILTDPSRRVAKGNRRNHELSGVARCDVCGAPLYTTKASATSGRAYTCTRGQHVSIAKVAIEAHVDSVLLARFARRDGVADWDVEPADDVLAARDEIDRLRRVLDEHENESIAGRLTAARFANIEAKILGQIANVEATVKRTPMPSTFDALRSSTDPQAYWDGMTIEERTALIRALLVIRVGRHTNPGSNDPDLGRVNISWAV
jgi:DNA invertase Pin-like site-specific DNA recombinase